MSGVIGGKVSSVPGTTESAGRLASEVGPQEAAAPAASRPEARTTGIVLAGPEAIALRSAIQDRLTGMKSSLAIVEAESILEAVLMSNISSEAGDAGAGEADGGRPERISLVVAGVSQELEQLEGAVRSLRKVYPQSRILLACDPGDEVLCRKAKGWGATDYLILPADHTGLQQVVTMATMPPGRLLAARSDFARTAFGAAGVMREAVGIESPAPRAAAPSTLQLPALPLMVQTTVMSDLLAGRPDFAERVVAILNEQIPWEGKVRFVPAMEMATEKAAAAVSPRPQEVRVTVALGEQATFGELVLDSKHPAAATPALNQAAHWMASLLSVSRRYEQLRSLAITDELSGAYNRRYFSKFMNGLLERARVGRFRVTLLLFDIDDFKKYNDRFGHAAGDAIIRELIKLLRACTRPHDLVARLGGDEFAVVFWDNEAPRQPNSEHPRDAISATDRFRKAIKNHHWPEICKIQGEVSISGGLATFPWDADTLEMLMERADEALLRAKGAGKNAILLHGGDCPPPVPAEEPQG